MPVFIDPRICEKEGICDLVEVCPRGAIAHNKGEKTISVDHSRCIDCLLCLKACPYLAVRLAKDEAELKELERDARRRKLDKGKHLAMIYGVKPGKAGKAELNDSNFDRKVKAGIPTLVSFWGAHSGVIAPFLREIGRGYKGKLRVAHIKVADNPRSLKKYSVRTTPTLILFREGKEIGRLEGIRHKATMRVWLDAKLTTS